MPSPIGAYVRGRSANPACSTDQRPTVPCLSSPIPHLCQCCAWQQGDKTKTICQLFSFIQMHLERKYLLLHDFSVGRLGPNKQIARMPKAFPSGMSSPIRSSELSGSLYSEPLTLGQVVLEGCAARFGLNAGGASHWQVIGIAHGRSIPSR